MRPSVCRRVAALALVAAAGLTARGPLVASPTLASQDGRNASSAWLPGPEVVRNLPPPLPATLESDPYAYFRFVNKPWARRVCEAFEEDLPTLPHVRLHGDAHVEQYAFTSDEYGLDDFDDSAEGPSVVDLVRFVGSLHIAVRRHAWSGSLDAIVDEFFRGYVSALDNPAVRPPVPAIVVRRRPTMARDPATFLAWAESLMEPVPETVVQEARDSLVSIAQEVARGTGWSPAEFRLKKVGRLRLGIGSMLTPKLLMRIEGATAAADDDVILEGKALSDLTGIACLDVRAVREKARVVIGSQRIGRLRHEVLSLVPRLVTDEHAPRAWWVRTWDRTYGEVDIDHFASAEELMQVARDAGAQLGSSNLSVHPDAAAYRARERQAVLRLQPKIRTAAVEMVRELLESWSRLTKERKEQ